MCQFVKDIVLKILYEFCGDKHGLQLLCKSFHNEYKHITRHNFKMIGIRNTLCFAYLTRAYNSVKHNFLRPKPVTWFIIQNPECQEHAQSIHRWYDIKHRKGVNDGVFINLMTLHLKICCEPLAKSVYEEYIYNVTCGMIPGVPPVGTLECSSPRNCWSEATVSGI